LSSAGPEVNAIPRIWLIATFHASFVGLLETCSRYLGDKNFTSISVTRRRFTASNFRRRFEDDSVKFHFGGIKTSNRRLIQMHGNKLRAVGGAILRKGDVMKRMTIVKSLASILFLFAFLAGLPAAHADQANQETIVTFSQPVQIPGRVLPAGTYVFVLPEELYDHFQVRIFNADRSMLLATLVTVSAERTTATSDTVFGFAERGSAQPEAIVTWFYPGQTTGHEFLYPKQEEKELAGAKRVTIFAGK
jgi:hypothetical protein